MSRHHYSLRLDALLKVKQTRYRTFESSIRKCLKSLAKKDSVTKQSLGSKVLPNKFNFWEQLKTSELVTGTVPKELVAKYSTGYWNPKTDVSSVQFEYWDCINPESFNWIEGLSLHDRQNLVLQLVEIGILNSKGQLIDLDLTKPIDIQRECMVHYKSIKDTLWNHSVYRFAVDHLKDCATIKLDEVNATNVPSKHTSDHPVVELIVAMNPSVNSSSPSMQYSKIDFKSSHTGSDSIFTLEDHTPDEQMNEDFKKQLNLIGLCETKVSGDGLNCLIHAMIQHAKREYSIDYFQEANVVRKSIEEKNPEMPRSDMLHADDHIAQAILEMVNDHCTAEFEAKIGTVSAVIASRDGPIIYGYNSDDRFPSGRHEVIWQQGNHFV